MKILIIEDEYNLADAISSMLKSKKYSVTIKTDGESGLDEALTDIYDLKEELSHSDKNSPESAITRFL